MAFILEGIGNALLSEADDAFFYEGLRSDNKIYSYSKIRGKIQLISAFSLGLSTFVGGLLYSISIYLPYVLQSIVLLIVIGLIIFTTDLHTNIEANDKSVFSSLRVFKDMLNVSKVTFFFIFSALIAALINVIFSFLPNYVEKLGFNASSNGLIFMLISFLSGLTALFSYRLNRLGQQVICIVIMLIVIMGMMLQIQDSRYLFLIGISLLYITVDILDPVVMTILNTWVDDSSRATVISGLSFLTTLLSMIVSPIAGFIVQQFGTIVMLMIIGIIITFISMTMLITKYKK